MENKRLSWQQVCICSYIDCALSCSDSLAPADRGLNEHRNRVRAALIALLTEPVTDKKHQEVLRRVFGPATTFDKPILNFDNPNLGRLMNYGIKNVVWETPACARVWSAQS